MRILATLILMLAISTFAESGVELPKNALIPIIVEELGKEATALGLTEDLVRNKVELQFRRNGLIPEDSSKKSPQGYYVYINISVVGSGWSWEVSFNRMVKYEVGSRTFWTVAETYSESATGTCGQSGGNFILEHLMNGVDMLSNEILKSAQ